MSTPTPLRLPRSITVLGALGMAALVLPLLALLVRAPWGRLTDLLTEPGTLEALRISLIVSVGAAATATVLGVPLALVLDRTTGVIHRVLRGLILLPLVLPPVVGGVALLFAFGRRGIVGEPLERWFGLTLPFSTAGAWTAATFVALPFVVLTVYGAVRNRGTDLEEAAATLGAGPWRRLIRVTIPGLAPAIAAGTALAWARAIGEFGATITFAGNVEGRTTTLPLAVSTALNGGRTDEALALSLLLMAISLATLITLRDRWWPTP